MKVYLSDDFNGSSIDSAKWALVGNVGLENGEAVIQETTEPGDVAVGGMLTSKVSMPPSNTIHFDHRFITNVNKQSGSGFWSTDSIFWRKSDSDWTQGENMQMFMAYHADTDAIVEAIFYLYHRSPAGATLIGKVNIPLSFFESLDVEGAGVVLRDLNVESSSGKFIVRVGDVEITQFHDANVLHNQSPVQFGTNSPVNLTAKFSIDNVLVTSNN